METAQLVARDFKPGRLDPNRTTYDYLIIPDFATPDPVGCMPREVYKLQSPIGSERRVGLKSRELATHKARNRPGAKST